jgi:hypothetical protein
MEVKWSVRICFRSLALSTRLKRADTAWMSQDSLISKRYWLWATPSGYTIGVWFPGGASIPLLAITSIPAIPAFYSVDIGHPFPPRWKTIQAWNCPLTSINCQAYGCTEICFQYPHNVHGVGLYACEQITPCTRVLERFVVAQMVKQLPLFVRTRGFNTVLVTGRHCSLSLARWIQSKASTSISRRPVLILFLHLHLGPLNGTFSSGFPTEV